MSMGYRRKLPGRMYLPTTAAVTKTAHRKPPGAQTRRDTMSKKTSFIAAAIAVSTLSLASLQPASAAVYVRGGAFYGPTATVKHVGYTRVTPWGVKHVGYTRVWRY
jgi:hypothetical protein